MIARLREIFALKCFLFAVALLSMPAVAQT